MPGRSAVIFTGLLSTGFIFTNACSRGVSPELRDSNHPKPATTKSQIKAEDLKYAGAVVIEVGIADAVYATDPKQLHSTGRIYICVDKTGKEAKGTTDILFSDLGIPGLTQEFGDQAKDGTWSHAWTLQSLTLNYQMTGNIEVEDAYAFGHVEYSSSQANLKWTRVMPKEQSSGADKADLVRLNESFSDSDGPFSFSTTDGTLAESSTSYYSLNGKIYYASAYLERMTKLPDGSLHAVDICEKENKPVVIQTTE